MTTGPVLAGTAGACLVLAVLLVIPAGHAAGTDVPPVAAPTSAPLLAVRRAWAAVGGPSAPQVSRRRRVALVAAGGTVVWAVSGWPAAGAAVVVAGLWLPWLLGAHRVVVARIAKLEALEGWCRRMADTLVGGGAVGLAQAITMFDGSSTAARVDDAIAEPVRTLARRLRDGEQDRAVALRHFADAIDDRAGDTVAAALLLALHQQSSGVAAVLRQLADGVARDVRARRDIEAARAESRQSIRLLLVIQSGLLVLLALVPTFSGAYGTPTGQVVMAVLLASTAGLLVWMRRLSLGEPSPRFFGSLHGGDRTPGGAR